MKLDFKFSIRWSIFTIIISSILIFLLSTSIIKDKFQGKYMLLYLVLLIPFCIIFFFPFMKIYGLREDYIVTYFFGFYTGIKHSYKNITYIQWVFPSIIIIYKYNLPVGAYMPLLRNQELMIKIILEKNPDCKISKSVARKLKKKFGESYDQYVEE